MNVTSCAMHCRFPIENGMYAWRGRSTTFSIANWSGSNRSASGPPVARVALRGERPDEDHVVLPDPVAAEHPVLEAAADRDRHRRVDPHRLLDHLCRVRQ